VVSIMSPVAGSLVSGSISVVGTAASAAMEDYQVQYGLGVSPSSWTTITTSSTLRVAETLATLDTTAVPDGPYTIRLVVNDQQYGQVTSEVLVVVRNDTAE